MKEAVLLGHPRYFRILRGANPHTRDRWGRRKVVDRPKMLAQWERFRQMWIDLGVVVFVLPPSVQNPGAVFPANAGMSYRGTVYLSRPNPARWEERRLYRHFLEKQGIPVSDLPDLDSQWEGEADTFPVGDPSGDPQKAVYLATYGKLERQRWRPCFGIPPYRRIYGFRTDARALGPIERLLQRHEVLRLELCDERYYHGDTCLCAFGPHREYLLAYLPALTPESQERLKKRFGDRIVALSDQDAAVFAANAYQVETSNGPVLAMSDRASDSLVRRIESMGVRVMRADVSEFMSKGGGSVKCMVLRLEIP